MGPEKGREPEAPPGGLASWSQVAERKQPGDRCVGGFNGKAEVGHPTSCCFCVSSSQRAPMEGGPWSVEVAWQGTGTFRGPHTWGTAGQHETPSSR